MASNFLGCVSSAIAVLTKYFNEFRNPGEECVLIGPHPRVDDYLLAAPVLLSLSVKTFVDDLNRVGVYRQLTRERTARNRVHYASTLARIEPLAITVEFIVPFGITEAFIDPIATTLAAMLPGCIP
jgi:hypothetical protein